MTTTVYLGNQCLCENKSINQLYTVRGTHRAVLAVKLCRSTSPLETSKAMPSSPPSGISCTAVSYSIIANSSCPVLNNTCQRRKITHDKRGDVHNVVDRGGVGERDGTGGGGGGVAIFCGQRGRREHKADKKLQSILNITHGSTSLTTSADNMHNQPSPRRISIPLVACISSHSRFSCLFLAVVHFPSLILSFFPHLPRPRRRSPRRTPRYLNVRKVLTSSHIENCSPSPSLTLHISSHTNFPGVMPLCRRCSKSNKLSCHSFSFVHNPMIDLEVG